MADGRKHSRLNEYERIEARAKRGEYTLVEPLDLIILKALPEEGTLFAGLYPLGETASNIAKAKLDGKLPVVNIAQRLSSLKKQGLVVAQTALGTSTNGAVWQRTEAGNKLLALKEGKDG